MNLGYLPLALLGSGVLTVLLACEGKYFLSRLFLRKHIRDRTMWLSYLNESRWHDCFEIAQMFVQTHRHEDFMAVISVFEQDIKHLVQRGFVKKSSEWRTPFGEMGCQLPTYQLTPEGVVWVSENS